MDSNSQAMIAKQGIIDVNNLSYNLKPDLSVTTSRTTTTQFFQQQTFPENGTMVVILNTGAAFVYGPNSTLTFDLQVVGTPPAANPSEEWGCYFPPPGSAANIFGRITIMSRSGVVLERIDSINLLTAIKLSYEHDESYIRTTGSIMGQQAFNSGGVLPLSNGHELPVRPFKNGENNIQRFVIPMSMISGLFSYENLLPSALMSGLRIEISLVPANQALTRVEAPVQVDGVVQVANNWTYTYAVNNPRIQCDSYMLTDSIMRTLNEAAASSGLEVVFPTYFTTIQTRTGNNLNMESRRACSRALSAFYTEQTPIAGNAYKTKVSTLNSKPITNLLGPTSVQFRAGSLYFPNSAIQSDNPVVAAAENYQMALENFNKYNTNLSSNLSFTDYLNTFYVLATTLERSTTLDLTGIPLSNSRVLALNAVFADAPAADNAFLFLEYVTLARVFISNCTVEV